MNPILAHLGFRPDDRVVIIHADDLGMCHATIPAVAELFDAGLVSSAATMVPCPWFPAVAAYARANPAVDIGVHATLTCEWDACRWGPLSTRERHRGCWTMRGTSTARPLWFRSAPIRLRLLRN